MATQTMNVKILQVTNTTAQWAGITDVLSKGLLAVEFTTDGKTKIKVGDGVKTFAELPYIECATDITLYYTKVETDAKIDEKIASLGNVMNIKGVKDSIADLPKEGNKAGDTWFVKPEKVSETYAEYIYTTEGEWEYIGQVKEDVDLTGYAKETWVTDITDKIAARVTTLEGTSHTHDNKDVLDATTASYTTEAAAQVAKVPTLEAASHTHENSKILDATTASYTTEKDAQVAKVAALEAASHTHANATVLDATTASYTTEEKEKLAGVAEGANKTVVDAAISDESTNPVQNKVIKAELDKKVAIVEGKDLSTNDYSNEEKAKLASLENYDDTEVKQSIADLTAKALKTDDTIVLNCTL